MWGRSGFEGTHFFLDTLNLQVPCVQSLFYNSSLDFPKMHNFTAASGVTFLPPLGRSLLSVLPFFTEMVVVTEWCLSAISCWWTWPLDFLCLKMVATLGMCSHKYKQPFQLRRWLTHTC